MHRGVALLATLLLAAGCGGGNERAPSQAGGSGLPPPPPPPRDPDISLVAEPRCQIVPNAYGPGTRDVFTMLVSVQMDGRRRDAGEPSLITIRIQSDTGLMAEPNVSVHRTDLPEYARTAYASLQVDLRPVDYDRTHRFTIEADPANRIRERDETNNQMRISTSLPRRPTEFVDPQPCSLN
jgi:hypothetical protein